MGLTGYNFYKDGTFDIYVWGDLEGKDVCKWSTKGNTIKMKCDGIDEYSGEYTYSLENDNQHLTIINNDIEYGYDKE